MGPTPRRAGRQPANCPLSLQARTKGDASTTARSGRRRRRSCSLGSWGLGSWRLGWAAAPALVASGLVGPALVASRALGSVRWDTHRPERIPLFLRLEPCGEVGRRFAFQPGTWHDLDQATGQPSSVAAARPPPASLSRLQDGTEPAVPRRDQLEQDGGDGPHVFDPVGREFRARQGSQRPSEAAQHRAALLVEQDVRPSDGPVHETDLVEVGDRRGQRRTYPGQNLHVSVAQIIHRPGTNPPEHQGVDGIALCGQELHHPGVGDCRQHRGLPLDLTAFWL